MKRYDVALRRFLAFIIALSFVPVLAIGQEVTFQQDPHKLNEWLLDKGLSVPIPGLGSVGGNTQGWIYMFDPEYKVTAPLTGTSWFRLGYLTHSNSQVPMADSIYSDYKARAEVELANMADRSGKFDITTFAVKKQCSERIGELSEIVQKISVIGNKYESEQWKNMLEGAEQTFDDIFSCYQSSAQRLNDLKKLENDVLQWKDQAQQDYDVIMLRKVISDYKEAKEKDKADKKKRAVKYIGIVNSCMMEPARNLVKSHNSTNK